MAPRTKSNTPLAKLKAAAEKLFLTPDQVDEHLSELEGHFSLSGLGIQVSLHDVKHEWGNCAGRDALSGKINDTGAKTVIYLSNESDITDFETQQALHSLLEAFQMVWSKEYRNQHGGLSLKASGAEDIFLASIRNISEARGPSNFSVIYADLDHFKAVNDKCSHEEGNKALRKVYAEMHKLARTLGGFAFFDGGDEFILVFPTDDILKISSGMWRLLKSIRAEKYGGELQIGLTAGVAIRSGAEIFNNFQNVKNFCESLTKNADASKTKKRGTISFEMRPSKPAANAEKSVTPSSFYKLGISLSRCRQSTNDPFEDERLNLITHQIIDYSLQTSPTITVNDAVSEITNWFGSTLTNELLESSLLHATNSYATISKHAVSVAVAHGLASALARKNSNEIESISIKWSSDASQVAVMHNGEKFWGDDISDPEEITYGPPIRTPLNLDKISLFAGVQIGFDEKPKTPGGNRLPSDFLVDHVRVDVRPKTGGGLPDFWQVALAQVVSCLGGSENIVKVLIWGDDIYDSETYKRLSNPLSWSIDEIAHLTGLDSEKIRHVGDSILSKIAVTVSPEDLLNEIYLGYQSVTEFISIELNQEGELGEPLPRPMATTTPLSQSEGAVCTTAALAYPIIIDTLRKSREIRSSKDDAEQEQRELIAFKLKLTNPLVNPVPAYLKKQASELEDYARRVLLDPEGIIRISLEESNQVSAFINHLFSYVSHKTKTRSTRRACMVVPHVPTDENTPKPWGLISVWATPRYTENGTTYIDFAFVWRTVEAFIGLPYSLYGSIRLAEDLVNQIREKFKALGGTANISLGELNYIALSLHIGGDQYHSRVAKQIVDLASE